MKEKIAIIKQMVINISADSIRAKRIAALQRNIDRFERILKTANTPWLLARRTEAKSRLEVATAEPRRLPAMDPEKYATLLYMIRSHLRGRIHIRTSHTYKIEGDLLDFQAGIIESAFQHEDRLEKMSWYKPQLPVEFREMVRSLMKQPLPLRREAA